MNHRIFITGASGYIGSAVAERFVRAGHEVSGLARSEAAARALKAIGVTPVAGDLTDSASWIGVLQNCDSAVHTAFDPTGASSQDHLALEAFRAASLDGRLRRVLYTSGIWVHGAGGDKLVDESSPLRPLELVQWRTAHEEIALDLSAHDVDTIILRPGMVYGESRGILGSWFAEAREKKTVTFPGDGSQHWAMVHREDVAEAYALALEHGKGGERYLLSDESRHTVQQLAEAAAAAAGATAQSWPADDVVKTLSLFGKALLNDLQVTSAKARRELGWVPRHTSFVTEAPSLWREWLDAKEAPVT